MGKLVIKPTTCFSSPTATRRRPRPCSLIRRPDPVGCVCSLRRTGPELGSCVASRRRRRSKRARESMELSTGFRFRVLPRSSLAEFTWNWPPWKNLPERFKLTGTTSLAFVICNMDKVILSVAIIPMSHQFHWSSSVVGLVLSSFFWGNACVSRQADGLPRYLAGEKILRLEYPLGHWLRHSFLFSLDLCPA